MDEIIEDNEILSWDLTKSANDIAVVEMGNNDFAVYCTLGKIILWFGRRSTFEDISEIVRNIAKIDPSVEHEKEVICNFDEITGYENKGCTVISYAKNKGGGYRAIFTISFHNKSARNYFIDSVIEELNQSDVKKTLHWNGNIAKIMLLFNELKKLPNLTLLNVRYKEDIEGRPK
jgi:hypothetical protein